MLTEFMQKTCNPETEKEALVQIYEVFSDRWMIDDSYRDDK